jgi:hypothetical protein
MRITLLLRTGSSQHLRTTKRRRLRERRHDGYRCIPNVAPDADGITSGPVTTRSCLQRFFTTTVIQTAQPMYQDPALIWAKSNPAVAQRCLEPPPPIQQPTGNYETTLPQTLEEYLERRQWKVPTDDDQHQEYATALISHVLSAPLTVGSQLAFLRHDDNDDDEQHPQQQQQQEQQQQRWCCVGARAEASLPTLYWKECLWMLDVGSKQKLAENNKEPFTTTRNIALEFMGPDLPPKIPTTTIVSLGSTAVSMTLQGDFRGFYHEMPSQSSTSLWDAMILFNPGLAHPNLQTSWRSTLDAILHHQGRETQQQQQQQQQQQKRKPCCRILLTAHSAKDADRDAKRLREEYGMAVEYQENPFASRIRYQDPLLDPSHHNLVRPNHYVATMDVGK